MAKVVILNMSGKKKGGRINKTLPFHPQISNLLKNKGAGDVQELGSWPYRNNEVKLYGWAEGKAGKENKHEIPPPLDTDLYFGDLLAVKTRRNLLKDFTQTGYDDFFEEMYGGFEDIGDSDTEYSETETETDSDSY